MLEDRRAHSAFSALYFSSIFQYTAEQRSTRGTQQSTHTEPHEAPSVPAAELIHQPNNPLSDSRDSSS